MGGCEIPVAPSAATPGLTQRGRYAWSPLPQSVVRQRGSAARSEQKTWAVTPRSAGRECSYSAKRDQQMPSEHCAEEQSVSECSEQWWCPDPSSAGYEVV